METKNLHDRLTTSRLMQEATVRCCGLDVYKSIMTSARTSGDLSQDVAFQRSFTYFYRVRRPIEWLYHYYHLFQTMRSKPDVQFADIISAIAAFSDNRVEISFASKMLATINPDLPIWDRYVRDSLGLPDVPPSRSPKRLEQAAASYALLTERMNALLASESVKNEIAEFDRAFPKYADFTPMKKLDYLIWGTNRAEV